MPDEKQKEKKAPKADKPKPEKVDKAQAGAKPAKAPKAAQPTELAHDADQPHQPARLKDVYKKEIAPALTKQFGYKTPMQVPRISKITLNMGVGEATSDKKILDNAVGEMTKI